MEQKDRSIWYYSFPLLGILFGLWYVRMAFANVVYSDYIRLVDTYLPDVRNPEKFLVPDLLTRIPITYLGRILNTTFFHYSLRFDQALGVLGLGLSGFVLVSGFRRLRISWPWALGMMVVLFSLNKWEMLLNGSGWPHFWAFAAFYLHYGILDRIWTGQEKSYDRLLNLLLPSLTILLTAGPYGMSYAAVLILAYAGIGWAQKTDRRGCRSFTGRQLTAGLFGVLIPLGLYLLSNHFAVEDHDGAVSGGMAAMLRQLLETPTFFVRFFLKSLSSMAVSQEFAELHFLHNAPWFVLGGIVGLSYLLALFLYWKNGMYRRTLLPLLFMLAGGINHVLVLIARWVFLREDYGISSRYALQYQIGILGVLLVFALLGSGEKTEAAEQSRADNEVGQGLTHSGSRVLLRLLTGALLVFFLVGNLLSTQRELEIAPYRRVLCEERAAIALDFENRSDEELQGAFEYRTSRPETGPKVRRVLTILKENNWNVFYVPR